MPFPLRHPEFVLADPVVDNKILRKAYKVWGPRLLAVRLAMPFWPLIRRVGQWRLDRLRKSVAPNEPNPEAQGRT